MICLGGVTMVLKIKELREEYQLTQKGLADLLSNSQRNISNWESGTSEPDCETIVKLAEIFKVSLDELFGRTHFFPSESDGNEHKLLLLYRKLNEAQQTALYQLLLSFTSH